MRISNNNNNRKTKTQVKRIGLTPLKSKVRIFSPDVLYFTNCVKKRQTRRSWSAGKRHIYIYIYVCLLNSEAMVPRMRTGSLGTAFYVGFIAAAIGRQAGAVAQTRRETRVGYDLKTVKKGGNTSTPGISRLCGNKYLSEHYHCLL